MSKWHFSARILFWKYQITFFLIFQMFYLVSTSQSSFYIFISYSILSFFIFFKGRSYVHVSNSLRSERPGKICYFCLVYLPTHVNVLDYSSVFSFYYYNFAEIDMFLLLWFWLMWLLRMLIIGWLGSNPRTTAIGSLDSVPVYSWLFATFPFYWWLWSPPLFPLKDSPAWDPCLQSLCSHVHLSLLLLPPLRGIHNDGISLYSWWFSLC